MLRTSTATDLPAIARCHRNAFPDSLATALGQRYVVRMLSWYLSTDKTFLFHHDDGPGRCIGYCGGIISDGSLHTGSASGMAQHAFKEAVLACLTHPQVFFHPELRAKWPVLRKNILMKLGLQKRVHFSAEQKKQMAQDPHAGLVVIGVDPGRQGKGYGSLLLQEFERRAMEQHGIRKLQLTVLSGNQAAIRAYERNGWQQGKAKGESLEMVKLLQDSEYTTQSQ